MSHLGAMLLALSVLAPLQAQSFDTSGTANLTGLYLFRYVNFFNDEYGNLTESCMLTGVMSFDGQGHYTLSNTQLFDSLGSTTGYCAALGGGTYGVESNGMAQFDNPMYPATLFGAVSQPVIIASSTEDFYFDLFIAIEAPASGVSNSTLSGSFTGGTLDYFNASLSTARQGYFTLTADGKGNIAAFKLNGSAANVNSGDSLTQSVAASTYALSGTQGGTWNIPGSDNDTQILSGTKTLYVSADGNWILGGSPSGSDMIFGFLAPTKTASNAFLDGTYYLAGMVNNSNILLGAYYGSINTNGNGDLIEHQRYDYVVPEVTYDYTTYTPVTIGANGSYFDGSTYTYLVSGNGNGLISVGSNSTFGLTVAMRAAPVTATSSVWIDPVAIINSANYTPITNSYAPGEMVSLYGSFGVSLDVDQKIPVPTSLDGVYVYVNGHAAPVLLVSPNQINVLIPYEIAGDGFATFQVDANNSKSNSVTVYVADTAPGIFTLAENGLGLSAVLHADYSLVNDQHPAQPGEVVLLFMEGLGGVTPPVLDGAPGGSQNDVNEYDQDELSVALDDGVDQLAPADIDFAGLAPGFAGLYQVNFALPTAGLANGDVSIVFGSNEATSEMSTIAVSGFQQSSARKPSARRAVLPIRHAHTRGARRRALPDRETR